jgi:hypothetical protein
MSYVRACWPSIEVDSNPSRPDSHPYFRLADDWPRIASVNFHDVMLS